MTTSLAHDQHCGSTERRMVLKSLHWTTVVTSISVISELTSWPTSVVAGKTSIAR